jgi:methylmalonyl-CoA mutase cobalamin-binding subunit
MNSYEKQMLAILSEGKERHGIVAVKAEFEAEGTRVDELLRLLEIARRAGVKVGLKIGGCEAVRDLIECRQFGVDYIIAPMVETEYALSKYVAALEKVFPADERDDIKFLVNVETRSTFENLAEIAELAGKHQVGLVFGRVDFAGSLGHDRSFVNSPELTDYVLKCAEASTAHDIELVVGGGVGPESIEPLRRVRETKLSRFETRKVIFDASILSSSTIEDALAAAIEFELLWLKNKRDYYVGIGAEDEQRIAMMERRRQTMVAAAA